MQLITTCLFYLRKIHSNNIIDDLLVLCYFNILLFICYDFVNLNERINTHLEWIGYGFFQ